MVKQVGPVESFWDDDITDDANCEEYLQKARGAAENDADDDDEADDDEENDSADDESADEEDTAEDDAEEIAKTTDGGDEDDSDDDPAEETATTTKRRKSAKPTGEEMAKTKAGGKTKAEFIREVIEARRKAGEELRPRDIIAVLEKKGVEVNASQVSITLRAMGVPPLRRGKEKAKRAPVESNGAERSREALKIRGTAKREKLASAASDMGETEQLLNAAADFMHTAGGFEEALAALRLYNNVVSRN